jgi:hypothetical protein
MRLNTAHGNEDEDIAEQKLWRAVIANTVREWMRGPLQLKRAAEQYLFRDEQDYRTVCCSAGIDPGNLRDRLQIIRARADSGAHPRTSKN